MLAWVLVIVVFSASEAGTVQILPEALGPFRTIEECNVDRARLTRDIAANPDPDAAAQLRCVRVEVMKPTQ